jgi:enamine deaminase RidA (YjgF/YER057c/UK114 family)
MKLTNLKVACLITSWLLAAISCPAQQRRTINLAATSTHLPFSDGIVVGSTLYISAQQGARPSGKLAVGIAAQTRAALENIQRVVQTAGLEIGDVRDGERLPLGHSRFCSDE